MDSAPKLSSPAILRVTPEDRMTDQLQATLPPWEFRTGAYKNTAQHTLVSKKSVTGTEGKEGLWRHWSKRVAGKVARGDHVGQSLKTNENLNTVVLYTGEADAGRAL